MKKLSIPPNPTTSEEISELHAALQRLSLTIEAEEVSGNRVGNSTRRAIRRIQTQRGLDRTGYLDAETLDAVNAELFNAHHTLSKARAERLHGLIEGMGKLPAKAERQDRRVGRSTRTAIKRLQEEWELPADGKVSESFWQRLNDEAVKRRFDTKTQVGKLHTTLKKIRVVSKLAVDIDTAELQAKELGATSRDLIQEFQEKYKLEPTGEMDKATLDKMNSVAASRGSYTKKLKTPKVRQLKPINRTLRLNMVSPRVSDVQRGLAYLGYSISDTEYRTQRFGKSTTKAIKKVQAKHNLPQTGHLDNATRRVFNNLILRATGPTAETAHRYRIRGSVRDELWKRKSSMVIKIYEKVLDQVSAEPLAAKKNFLNGFFDLPYDAPIDPVNGQIKDKFHLVVNLYEAADQDNPVATQTHYNVKPIHWVNFTQSKNAEGDAEYLGKYAGPSDYEATGSILRKAIKRAIITLKETEEDKQISELSLQTGLTTDEIMCHILSHLVAQSVDQMDTLDAEVFYAFIRQNLPADLPGDLLRGTSDWETIDQLLELAASGIVFLDDATQEQVIDNALTQNLVSQKVKVGKDAILAALRDLRTNFTLTKPILVGNGSLESLLKESSVDEAHYSTVASVFIRSKGVNPAFWQGIDAHAPDIGEDAITDLAATIEAGNVSKNHIPTVSFLKSQLGNDHTASFKKVRHIAKLDVDGFVALIERNGGQVPDYIPGASDAERVANFAVAMKTRADSLFPADSLVGEVKRSGTDAITRIHEVESFLDEHDDLDLRQQNLDQFLRTHPSLDAKTTEELKVVQRVHKLTLDPAIGATLIAEGFHSSRQIYFAGKEQLKALMAGKGIEDRRISQMYESSKAQYLQILARLMDFRPEIQKFTPVFISPHTYSEAEIQAALGDIPNLEGLFGSMDFCDCEHCKSLYSPSAYLTDMLRFLNAHRAVDTSKTVKDVLFERRPDIGNIRLNCFNTNTTLPYIDLVCEVLENYLIGNRDFVHQSTLSSQELRATPEHVQSGAYAVLADADYPMNVSFNLWQDEARTYLNHLTVPRFELMEAFQDKSDPNDKKPDDATIAAEFFGMSSKERNLITTPRPTAIDQNKYWGFDTNQPTISVKLFMERSKLKYRELLDLLMVRFVNDPDGPQVSVIERPSDFCDTDLQKVIHLSLPRYDLMHRFIRLWRTTSWEMWELDLLLRNPRIGSNVLNEGTLTNLKLFKQLQDRLELPLEALLAFYGEINREIRIDPVDADVLIQPLYNSLFQDRAVTNPVDGRFKGTDDNHRPTPLDATILLGLNEGAPHNGYSPVPTILSALALTQSDFDLLVGKTDNHLSVASLSTILRFAYLARSLKLSIEELALFLDATNTVDPFASLQETVDAIDNLELIGKSGLSIREIDFCLNHKPDSPIGLRDESISRMVAVLRNIILSSEGAIARLKLAAADRDAILDFDADGLLGMSDADLAAALAPLTDILNSSLESFIAAAFSVEETGFITSFDTTVMTEAGKASLVRQIKTVQQNLSNLLHSSENQIKSHIASSFALTDHQANVVATRLIVAGNPLLDQLSDESLTATNAEGDFEEINSVNFADHFSAYALLHKVALLVSKLKIEAEDLEWFIANAATADTLDFSALPTAALAPNNFQQWRNLVLLLQFRSRFPEPEVSSIRGILALAGDATRTLEEIFAAIAALTQWDPIEIAAIHEGLRTQHAVGSLGYVDADLYHRLLKCFEQMKLTGVDATTLFGWAKITDEWADDMAVSVQTRQAVKSKYDQNEWLDKATRLHDDIRERKRNALAEYHLENSQRNQDPETVLGVATNPLFWQDKTALYKYLLIDTEISACQLTSRVKQALSSVQLFVQRCFLNLEKREVEVSQDQKEDTSSPNAWSQWKWMKNYRIWEANRKIFFYPENWIEPELRDDKSPFFEELENELLQDEVTKESVEAAFLNYLHKVDEVSRLEVCGMYHEMEDLNPGEAGYETNVVHVIGRTRAAPSVYYYRTYDMNYGTWSAWEKIDVDITGDHVTPVVYNRKLHLFWLQFMDKPMKANKIPAAEFTDAPTPAAEPRRLLEVQLAWTIRKSGGWTTKKVSKQKLIHPWERPTHSYNLKPWYGARLNELYLDIYLSTSEEFNNGRFYDPNALRQNNPVYLTKNRFDERYLPWHSSSFVFDGEVKDVKLKGLGGRWNHFGLVGWGDDSYDFVHENFGAEGAAIKELDPAHEYGPRLKLPTGMHFHNTHLTNNRHDAVNNRHLRVLEDSDTATLLSAAVSPFELVITQQDLQMNTMTSSHPMFYQDGLRSFFIKPEWETRLDNYGRMLSQSRKYRFTPFYHPYTTMFLRELNRGGLDGLLNRDVQILPETYAPKNDFNFDSYEPSEAVLVGEESAASPQKREIVDFSFGSSQAIYNWELFFHAPLLVANSLMQNQRFEDAMHWFHSIFDPTNIENYPAPNKYWVTKPFFEYNTDERRRQRIESILSNLNVTEHKNQLIAWRNNPFNPHIIARYRPVAYQKNVVMKYLDNLIAWADRLFMRDSIESINEASLLYLLAYEILGDRPQNVPPVMREELTFNELESKLDDLGNARVDVVLEDTLVPIKVVATESGVEPIPDLETTYFCIPHNDLLSKYWDTIEDRLFKVRHCMNIEGTVRQLPLFEPPIDPALLVKAAAAGVDLSSVLNDISAPTPYYRFRIVVQKAIEFCNEVRGLGERLLSALEKKDTETLSLLRSQHEIDLLEAVKEVRKKQIDDAEAVVASLREAKGLAEEKQSFYEGQDFVNVAEGFGLGLSAASLVLDAAIATGYVMSGGLKLIPAFLGGGAGFGGSPTVHVTMGGQQIGNGAEMAVRTIQSIAAALDKGAALSNTIGSYQHRKDDWDLQGRLASIEKDQVQFQIDAATIRKTIAEKEFENQELQIADAKAVDDYMRSKYTNEQLYSWMISQVSTVYFQAYQLAFDMAKRAEKSFQHELAIEDSNIIRFGYWDSLKKGLLSGDKLMGDLRKLEAEYVNRHKREFEITKHVSLAQVSPLSLITLKETGTCNLSLPEWIFDMDYPGHYMRRIKSVSVSIPSVVGPFAGVNCTLSLLRNETRMDPTGDTYERQEDDTRFKVMFGTISSIATSHAQNDSGMFELSFHDDRYLPFEGAGVISDWKIDLPIENNHFSFDSLSDVILHIRYTSRQGGAELANKAHAAFQAKLPTQSARLFSLKHDYGTAWHRFLNPEGENDQELVIGLQAENYPYFVRGNVGSLKIKGLYLFVESRLEENFKANLQVTSANVENDLDIDRDPNYNNVHVFRRDFEPGPFPKAVGELRLKIRADDVAVVDFKSLEADTIDDIYLLVELGL